ncbi:SDR family NAD(P)-dependent oxidoreductase [Chloroflexota bacterium]
MNKLQGKVAIVTGGGKGIGKGIALAFAKEGAKVVVCARTQDTIEAVSAEINEVGGEGLAVICDVGIEEDVKELIEKTIGNFGQIDILVNNAISTGFSQEPLELIDEVSWDNIFQTGPKATWYCCKAVFPYMKGKGGKIINLGSRAGIQGIPGFASYNAAKEAIRAFSRTAAREWGKYNINVNVICPAATSPAYESIWKAHPDLEKASLAQKSIQRWGDPEVDIGRAAVFLASNDSDYITGQTIMVSGGDHMF